MSESGTHGILTDYATGEQIRPATADELARTQATLASGEPGAYTGAWLDEDGRAVFVEE